MCVLKKEKEKPSALPPSPIPCYHVFSYHLVGELNSQPLLIVVKALGVQLRPVHPQEDAGRRVEDRLPCRPRQKHKEDADDTPVNKRTSMSEKTPYLKFFPATHNS